MNKGKEAAKILRAAQALLNSDRDFYLSGVSICLTETAYNSAAFFSAHEALMDGLINGLPDVALPWPSEPAHYTVQIMWLELMAICAETGEFSHV